MYKVKDPDPNIIARFTDPDTAYERFKKYEDERDTNALRKKIARRMDKLKIKLAAGTDTVTLMRRVYSFVDWLVETLGHNKYSVCQRGCAYCCAVSVDVSRLEAEAIAIATGRAMKNPTTLIRHAGNDYCPLLNQSTGECSVYELRPLTCRTFATMDSPEYCVDSGTTHAVVGASSIEIANRLHSDLILNSGQVADIRQWFD